MMMILILLGLLGLFAHWAKRHWRGQSECSFTDYLLTHKRHTAASVLTLIGSVVGLFAVGDVELTQQTAALAFMAGYNIDSAVNKGPEDSA
ncbi:hypothetical protein ACQE3E_06670 [Methylomonas sp. MED-D]|uniref:hypothetical protein n=1 Tax=Methylomonas sp. MED-D TaxID=3418768 RepID=UPI003D08230C